MTVTEMVDFVCGKVNQVEPEDKAACRLFLQRRHDLIWRDQLWKDSLFEYTQTISPTGYAPDSTWLPTKQVLILPVEVEHVIAVRTGIRMLEVESSETFYRSNFDNFASTGDSRQFRDLPRAVWDFDTAQTLWLLNYGAAKTTAILSTIGDDLITRSNETVGLAAGATEYPENDVARMDAFSKSVSDGDVSSGLAGSFTVTFVSSGAFTNFGIGTTNDPTQSLVNLTNGQSAAISVTAGQTLQFFFGNPVLGWHFTGYTVTSPFGLLTVTDTNDGNGNAGVSTFANGSLDPEVIRIAAADTNAPLRCRIQLIGSIPNPTTLRVLAKTRTRTFENDNDEPLIVGLENCLMAFAQADMLQRERRYGQAQAVAQEGATLLEQLKKTQTVQQAYNKRLIPSGGYNDEWQLNSGIYTVFP